MFLGKNGLGKNQRFFLSLFFFLFQAFSAYPYSLKGRLDAIVHEPVLRGAKIGVYVQLLGTHKTLFSYHANEPFIPASNLKILTTSAALVTLGPDYRFVTRVLGGKIKNGALEGNLILKGGGDPTWNSHFFPSPLDPLKHIAKELRKKGIKEVDGDLVVDDSLFSHQFTGIGWKYRYRWASYAEEISALSLNNNRIRVTVLPESYGGAPIRVVFWPPCHVIHVSNHAWTSDNGTSLSISRHKIGNRLIVYGHIYRYSNGIAFPFNVQDPPLFVGSAFKSVLRKYGIRVIGRVREIRPEEIETENRLGVLATFYSPRLIVIVRHLLKWSVNFLAEHIFRMIGAADYGKGSIQSGEEAVVKFLNDYGILHHGLVMDDGSGLSGFDRVSPRTLVEVMQKMASLPVGPIFRNALNTGNEGTLEGRLAGVNVRAKDGAIRHVSSLTGYVVTTYGQTLVFSIIFNHFGMSEYNADGYVDQIVRTLAKVDYPL